MTGEIVGREAELSVVHAFLDRPPERLTALVLEGEAGIGKSTIWLAGVAAARERSLRVLISRPAESERMLANLALGDLFGDTAPEQLASLPAPRRRAFESALLREEPDIPVDPRALGVAILTLLPILADGRTLVLAIDDEQWLDPSSAATLGFALRRSLHVPILLLLARRVDGASTTALEEAIDPAEVTRLRVGPLSGEAIQLLIRRQRGKAFPKSTSGQIEEVSGGNPFYALELARARSADPARDTTLPLAVPPSLERLVGARLGALDAPTQRALLLVAANGRLPVGLLRALGIAPDVLDQAREAKVIETSNGLVRYTHPLLASALYQGVAGDERRAAHQQLAMVVDDPVHRGRHLALASDEPDVALAAALESAASAARHRGMPIAAAELAEHAIRLTPLDEIDDLHRRTVATARAHLEAGDGNRARSIVDDLLTRSRTGPRRAEALLVSSELTDPVSAVALLLEALDESAGSPGVEAAIHAGLADLGRFTEGRAWAERHARASLRLAERLDDDVLRATALSRVAILRFERGDRLALELAERAHRLAASLPDPRQAKGADWSAGHVLTWSGMTEPAREWLEHQVKIWGDRDERVRCELLWHLALVELWSGRWGIASEYADESQGIWAHYGPLQAQDHLPPALIALHRGQFAVATDHSRRALAGGKALLLPAHIAVLAVCDLWSGNAASALGDFIRAEQTADARGWDEPNLRWWRGEFVEALLQLGRIDEAARLVADWEAAAARLGRDRVLAQAVRCRGLVAAARGDLATAHDLLVEAVDRHESVGDPFGRARSLLGLGAVRRRARQKRSARKSLEAALAGFEAIGAISWVAEVRVELARIGGRRRMEGLSPSERSVAELVGAGRTNREIAAALFLRERTVASHLTHIYAKLGVRSRTELVGQLLSQAPVSPAGASKVQMS